MIRKRHKRRPTRTFLGVAVTCRRFSGVVEGRRGTCAAQIRQRQSVSMASDERRIERNKIKSATDRHGSNHGQNNENQQNRNTRRREAGASESGLQISVSSALAERLRVHMLGLGLVCCCCARNRGHADCNWVRGRWAGERVPTLSCAILARASAEWAPRWTREC